MLSLSESLLAPLLHCLVHLIFCFFDELLCQCVQALALVGLYLRGELGSDAINILLQCSVELRRELVEPVVEHGGGAF